MSYLHDVQQEVRIDEQHAGHLVLQVLSAELEVELLIMICVKTDQVVTGD